MSVVRIEKPSSPQAEEEVLRRLRMWRETLGKPLAPGRANPDNDLFYLMLDAEEAIEGLRKSIGWTDKHSLSSLPDECARLKKSSTSPRPVTWPGKGYDHNQSGGFDGPTGAD